MIFLRVFAGGERIKPAKVNGETVGVGITGGISNVKKTVLGSNRTRLVTANPDLMLSDVIVTLNAS